MFYAHLQQIAYDYKEMMAAVVVILMAFYHIIRTMWGLMQLDAYHIWCKDMAKRMLILEMVDGYKWKWMRDEAEMSFKKKFRRDMYSLARSVKKT